MRLIGRTATLIIATLLIAISLMAAGSTNKPLVLIFPSVEVKQPQIDLSKSKNAEKKVELTKPEVKICDPEVVEAISEQIIASGKMDVEIFNPENPAMQRKLLEKKVAQAVIDGNAQEENAIQIARAMGADYVLRAYGSVSSSVDVNLEMINVNTNERWTAYAASDIGDHSGPLAQSAKMNAIFNSASVAVSQILISTLGEKEMIKAIGTPPTIPDQKKTIVDEGPRDIQAEVDMYLKKAEDYLRKNNTFGAIDALRKAIDLQPTKVELRMGLAELYEKEGLLDYAIDEYKRALIFDSGNRDLYDRLVKMCMAKGKLDEACAFLEDYIRLEPTAVDAWLTLGDLYWNQSRIEDVEKAYLQAEQISADNPRVQEKLYKLYYAKKQYDLAYDHLMRQKLLLSIDTSDVGRYLTVSEIIRDEFKKITDDLIADKSDFEKQVISREDFYKNCRDAENRIESLYNFVTNTKVPDKYKEANSHAVFAIGLLSQSCSSLISYFETEKGHYLDESAVFMAEAVNEMDIYDKAIQQIS